MNNSSDTASILAGDVSAGSDVISAIPTDVTSSQAHVVAVVSVACVLLVLVLLNLAVLLLYTRAKRSLKDGSDFPTDLAGPAYHYQLSSVDEDSHRHSYKPQSQQATASTQTTGLYKANNRRDGSKKSRSSSKRKRSEGREGHTRRKSSRRRRFEEEEENRVNAQAKTRAVIYEEEEEGEENKRSAQDTTVTASATASSPELNTDSSVITLQKAKSESALLSSTAHQVPFETIAPSTSDSNTLGSWRPEQFAMRSSPLTSESLVEADKNMWIPIKSAKKTTLTSQTCSTSSPKTLPKRHAAAAAEGGCGTCRSHSEAALHGGRCTSPEKQESLSTSLKKKYLETWQKAKNSIYGKHVTARKSRPGKQPEERTVKEVPRSALAAASAAGTAANQEGVNTNDDRQHPHAVHTSKILHHHHHHHHPNDRATAGQSTSGEPDSKYVEPIRTSSFSSCSSACRTPPTKSNHPLHPHKKASSGASSGSNTSVAQPSPLASKQVFRSVSKPMNPPVDSLSGELTPKRKDSETSTMTAATDCFENDGELRFVGVVEDDFRGGGSGAGRGEEAAVVVVEGGTWRGDGRGEVLLQDTAQWPLEVHNHALCFTAGLTSISSDDFDEIEL